MAKLLYEKAYIDAIAAKIRSLVPSLYKRRFTTAEIPEGIERVYEEGKSIGKTEGHRTGYIEGINRGETVGYTKGYRAALSSIPRAEGRGF